MLLLYSAIMFFSNWSRCYSHVDTVRGGGTTGSACMVPPPYFVQNIPFQNLTIFTFFINQSAPCFVQKNNNNEILKTVISRLKKVGNILWKTEKLPFVDNRQNQEESEGYERVGGVGDMCSSILTEIPVKSVPLLSIDVPIFSLSSLAYPLPPHPPSSPMNPLRGPC